MKKCKNCKKETLNPKFCSRSCSATVTNRTPKRVKTKKCLDCQELILSVRKRCSNCYSKYRKHNVKDLTYGELSGRRSYQKNSQIRDLARRDYRSSGKPLCCKICNYDNHVHICHIKPINEFEDSSLVSEINDLKNLQALCPNHHWELDNGYLKL